MENLSLKYLVARLIMHFEVLIFFCQKSPGLGLRFIAIPSLWYIMERKTYKFILLLAIIMQQIVITLCTLKASSLKILVVCHQSSRVGKDEG